MRLPWLHLVAGGGASSLKPADFRTAFAVSGLEVERLRVTPTEGGLKRAAMAALSLLARAPGLEPFFAVGGYAVLRKPPLN